MSAKAAAASPANDPQPKPKGKLKLVLGGLLAVLVLGGAGAGGAWFMLNRGGHAPAAHEAAAPAEPKQAAATYMPLENLVVNLSDGGGERVAQIGIVLELDDEKTAGLIKAVQPVVRSRVLVMVSQRTADELLKRDGKEKLANDIAREVARTIGVEGPPRLERADRPEKAERAERAEKAEKAVRTADTDGDDIPLRKVRAPGPVRGVLFSSFIVQ